MSKTRRSAAAAVALLALAILLASIGTASSQTVTTMQLNFPKSDPDAFTDGGAPGPGVGDELYIKGPVTDETDANVGRLIADVVTFSKDGSKCLFTVTITLNDRGTLEAVGELDVSGVPDQGTLAIVGGTGEFDGAQGLAASTIEKTGNVIIDITLL